METRTIAAIATPPGEGGVAIIRISGKEAIAIAERIFSRPISSLPSHTAHFGKILHNGKTVDEVLLLIMRAPKSYTGEDTVEIQCHGGGLITKKVLEAVLEAGAHAAGPGEFTLQAFLNGKLDLAQAEAVQTLIGAKNSLALDAARDQLSGKLSTYVQTLQSELINIAAILEAWVDFPEEGLEFASQEEVIASLSQTREKMVHLASTFNEGRKIQEGIQLCFIGTPNAGKSSLLNALLGHERAIVTPIAGTTRDLIDAELHLGGLHFHLFDTAGIRETNEIIEQEGIRRSKAAMDKADFIILLTDVSKPLTPEETELLTSTPSSKTLLLWNKTDLPHSIPTLSHPHQIALSAKTGAGIEDLKKQLLQLVSVSPEKDQIILTQARHKEALQNAIHDLTALIDGLKTAVSPEFISADMRSCLKNLGSIIGMDISEEILSSIFAKFCVGK